VNSPEPILATSRLEPPRSAAGAISMLQAITLAETLADGTQWANLAVNSQASEHVFGQYDRNPHCGLRIVAFAPVLRRGVFQREYPAGQMGPIFRR
jgi:hypothetical protein